MANLEDLIVRDTRANQPAFGVAGRLYFVTDESVLERDSGSAWEDVSSVAGGVASLALDNLASVAINDSLISDTDSTDSLGATAKKWLAAFLDTLVLGEQASAPADVAGDGQIWVKSDTPNTLWFTDDAGTDTQLSIGTLDYVEYTSNVTPTATTEATADTIVTANSITITNETIEIEYHSPQVRPEATSDATITFTLYDNGSSIGFYGSYSVISAVPYFAPLLKRRLTPAAGAHVYSIRAFVGTGTGLVVGGAGGSGNKMPGYIKITEV